MEWTCGHAIKSGRNKGTLCTRKWYANHEACKSHIPLLGKRLMKQQRHETQLLGLKVRLPIPIPVTAPFPTANEQFFENQIKAGQEVLQIYQQEPRVPYCVLVAQCQSGKTGAAKNVMRNFCNLHLDAIVILLIPIGSNDILNQARREFREELQPEDILSLPQMLNTNCLKERIDLHPERKFLIVIDESHMNALVEQSANCLYNTLRNANIAANGTQVPDNCWLLSISATPNAELSGLLQGNAQGKKAVVYLEPGEDYYGLKDMLHLDRIKQAVRLSTAEQQTAFIGTLQERYAGQHKYAIVRMKSHHHCEEFALRLTTVGIKSLIFDTYVKRTSQVATQVLVKPEEFTVILIVHRLRASIQLDTRNVCMVHENNIKNVDTTTQGLPGRMCGYGKRDHGVEVYCNPEAIRAQIAWLDAKFSAESIPSCRSVTGHYLAPVDADPLYPEPIRKSIYHCPAEVIEPAEEVIEPVEQMIVMI
jgi:hypothetical protein